MNRQLLTILGIGLAVVIIVLGVIVLGSSDKDITGAAVGDKSNSKLSEEERYAKFNAEVACDLAKIQEGEDVLSTLSGMDDYTTKYGFTTSEIESLQTKYQNDISIQQLAIEEMNNLCPDVVSQITAQLVSPNDFSN